MIDITDVKKLAEETKKRMAKSVESTKKEFQNIRTGRASIALVEGISVNYYNTPTPVKNLGTISTPDALSSRTRWAAATLADSRIAPIRAASGMDGIALTGSRRRSARRAPAASA